MDEIEGYEELKKEMMAIGNRFGGRHHVDHVLLVNYSFI